MSNTVIAVVLAGLILGVVILFAMRLLAAGGVSIPEFLSVGLRFMAKALIAMGLLGICSLIMPTKGFGLIAWLMVMTVWFRAEIHWRAVQKRSLFGALALAVDKQMPLPPVALAFADERHGGFGSKARALAERLKTGVPLIEAIKKSRGALPAEAAMAARVGAESGDLSGALEATSFGSRFDRTLLQTVISRLFYILPAVLLFTLFMTIKIAPSYVKIFDDFDTALPPITIAVLRPTSSSFAGFACFLLIVAMFVLSIWAWCEWRGWISPTLPGSKRIIKWVDMGVVLRVLALAARRNCPLPQMLDALADSHPKRWMRRRLRAVVTEIKEGCAWQKSLQIERLIGPADRAILAAAQRCGNLSWALDEMADSYQRKANYRLQALGQVVLPLFMLPLGLLVCVLAVAYFAPLTKLIEDLS
jgi:type II secretory pathway component PulF